MTDKLLEVYNKYKNDIYRLAISYTKNIKDSEDIMQNVFFKYYRKMSKIEDLLIKRWLIKVTINECKTSLMSPWKNKIQTLEENIGDKDNIDISFIEAFSKLSKKDSLIIHLYYYEGYKIAEISKLIKMSESNIKVRLYRSRQILKDFLKEE